MNRQILKGVVFAGLFAIPFIPFLVSSSLFFPFITTKAFAWRIIIEIVFAAWALVALSTPEYRPRRSWLLYSLLIFIAIIGVADIFGVAPIKSFWSNAERMEGFISLVHLGMFYVVVSSVFDKEVWRKWWNTSIAASLLMVVYCVFQLLGAAEIHQGGARVDGSLGNAAYLAVYLLFHIFVSLYYLLQSKSLKWLYGTAIVLNSWMLYMTATRGAILGILGGLLVVAVLSLWNKESAAIRRFGRVYVGALMLIVIAFISLRNTGVVQNSPVLSRFTTVSLSAWRGEGRAFVWPIALQGIKERPVLGWGQDNFNYVFNSHYSPEMYKFEPWFDRAHNIFLDWAIAGGLLGLIAYLSLYGLFLFYVWRPGSVFSFTEKSVLTGLLAAYFFHNLFVFDHLISYILFASLLAFVDSLSAAPRLAGKAFGEGAVASTGVPIAGVLLIAVLYFVNIRPISANMTLISALQNLGNENGIVLFEKAYGIARLGRPEIIEQIASNAPTILSKQSIPIEKRNEFFAYTKDIVQKQAQEFADDARYQLLAGDFLIQTGKFDEGIAYIDKALALMPGKQAFYLELASAKINMKDYRGALADLKRAYDLAPENQLVRVSYAVGAIYAGDRALEAELIATLPSDAYTKDERLLNAYVANNRFTDLVEIFRRRIALKPDDPQSYASLAVIYFRAGRNAESIETLNEIGRKFPSYKTQADELIKQIQNGTASL